MPDRRRHRGAHPEDAGLFGAEAWPEMRQAMEELSWLLSRGYAEHSALALVGNRHNLVERQRTAVRRCACSDGALARRTASQRPIAEVRGARLAIDGYNVLISIESALAGGVVLVGRDGCMRDLASIHGTYRRVDETAPAIELLFKTLVELAPSHIELFLDRPVSNSGRLAAMIEKVAAFQGAPCRVHLAERADPLVASFDGVVATSDSWILVRAAAWANLGSLLIRERCGEAWLVDLRQEADRVGGDVV